MKRIIPILLILLVSCGGQKMELDKAKTTAETLIEVIKAEQFDKFPDIYSKDFFQNITQQQWIDDLNKLKEILGSIDSYTLTETNFEHNIDKPDDIVLVYEIQHSKFKSHQTFTIIIEDGKYKVFGQHIKSDAL